MIKKACKHGILMPTTEIEPEIAIQMSTKEKIGLAIFSLCAGIMIIVLFYGAIINGQL